MTNALLGRALALAAVIVGLIHTLARRWSMNPDGISYLDIADRYAQGDWAAAVNATWSPALSWILAGVFAVFGHNPASEFMVAHLVLFVLYGCAVAAFAWFLSVLSPPPRPLYWTTLAYAIFLWSTLLLVDLREVTPDIGVVALTFVLGGLALRIREHPDRLWQWGALGALVGIAYLTKAVMLYVGIVLILATIAAVGRGRVRLTRLAAVAVGLALVAGPWIVALSTAKGRFTTGDVGRVALAWAVNGVTPVAHWQGLPRAFGTPSHPTRQLMADPHVYEFATPVPGTHPPRYDPSYWYDGVAPRVNLRRMASISFDYIGEFAWLVLPLLVAIPALAGDRHGIRRALIHWPVMVAMLIGIGLYIVLYFETRYVAAFLGVLYLASLAPWMTLPDERPRMTALALTLIFLGPVVYHTGLRAVQLAMLRGDDPHWVVAKAMHARGLTAGARIAVIGDGQTAYWARLAGHRVIAEIRPPQTEVFWSCGDEERNEVLQVFASTGAAAVVALEVPPWAPLDGWAEVAPGGPFLADGFKPQERSLAPARAPSYLDYRDVRRCAPRRL